jgi:hypothetical protein
VSVNRARVNSVAKPPRENVPKTVTQRRKQLLAGASAQQDAHTKRDAWLCGYAAALGAVMRLYNEAQIVESVIRADGLSPERLALGGAEEFDMKPIRRAWTRRKGDAKKGHVKQ